MAMFYCHKLACCSARATVSWEGLVPLPAVATAQAGKQGMRPALQNLYQTRAQGYKDALQAFIEGYREGYLGESTACMQRESQDIMKQAAQARAAASCMLHVQPSRQQDGRSRQLGQHLQKHAVMGAQGHTCPGTGR